MNIKITIHDEGYQNLIKQILYDSDHVKFQKAQFIVKERQSRLVKAEGDQTRAGSKRIGDGFIHQYDYDGFMGLYIRPG